MSVAVFGFDECEQQAKALAQCLNVPFEPIVTRSFPDGESLIRVSGAAKLALLYRSLDQPNAKLMEILLAAAALRDNGAVRVVLVAPYLAYMRQDMAFHPGEAVSQRVIGDLVSSHFDGLVTVDPHLHRVSSLDEIFTNITALNVSAAPVLGAALAGRLQADTILVGPDSESRPWVESIARPLGLEVLIGEKQRFGDRKVTLVVPDIDKVHGRPAVLVDDMISSGTTLIACAALLRNAGATSIAAIATHCLASAADLARLKENGITDIIATDSVPGLVATIPIVQALANAIAGQAWIEQEGVVAT